MNLLSFNYFRVHKGTRESLVRLALKGKWQVKCLTLNVTNFFYFPDTIILLKVMKNAYKFLNWSVSPHLVVPTR